MYKTREINQLAVELLRDNSRRTCLYGVSD